MSCTAHTASDLLGVANVGERRFVKSFAICGHGTPSGASRSTRSTWRPSILQRSGRSRCGRRPASPAASPRAVQPNPERVWGRHYRRPRQDQLSCQMRRVKNSSGKSFASAAVVSVWHTGSVSDASTSRFWKLSTCPMLWIVRRNLFLAER